MLKKKHYKKLVLACFKMLKKHGEKYGVPWPQGYTGKYPKKIKE